MSLVSAELPNHETFTTTLCFICDNSTSTTSFPLRSSLTEILNLNSLDESMHLDISRICETCELKCKNYEELYSQLVQLKQELVEIFQAKTKKQTSNVSGVRTFVIYQNTNRAGIDRSQPEIIYGTIISAETVTADIEDIIDEFTESESNDVNLLLPTLPAQELQELNQPRKQYECHKESCRKKFSTKYSLATHLGTHSDRVKHFTCEKCSKSFFTRNNLKQHLTTHVVTKSFKCSTCEKSFATQRYLDLHQISHSTEKAYFCSFCDKRFARPVELSDHERTHTGQKPFSCEVCGCSFTQRSNLLSHKRVVHLNEKRYSCTDCGRAFKWQRLLNYHIKSVHTKERPFTCTFCSAKFIYPNHLKKHERTHREDEKKHDCEICGRSFRTSENRNHHRFTHGSKKMYECLNCAKGFMRRPQLVKHINQEGHNSDNYVLNRHQESELSSKIDLDRCILRTIVRFQNEFSTTFNSIHESKEKIFD